MIYTQIYLLLMHIHFSFITVSYQGNIILFN